MSRFDLEPRYFSKCSDCRGQNSNASGAFAKSWLEVVFSRELPSRNVAEAVSSANFIKMDYAGANGFSFPVLTRSELLQCTDELKVDVTEEDINKPCTQRVLLIYDFFTDLLMGFTRDSFTQLSFRAQQQFNGQHDEQIYQDAIGLVSYFKQLRKLMADVGVDDFTMKDILRPDGQRFRRCLSALINFAKFREERFALFEEHTLRTVSHRTSFYDISAALLLTIGLAGANGCQKRKGRTKAGRNAGES